MDSMVRTPTRRAVSKRVVVLVIGIALMAALSGCYKTAKPVSVPPRTTVFTRKSAWSLSIMAMNWPQPIEGSLTKENMRSLRHWKGN